MGNKEICCLCRIMYKHQMKCSSTAALKKSESYNRVPTNIQNMYHLQFANFYVPLSVALRNTEECIQWILEKTENTTSACGGLRTYIDGNSVAQELLVADCQTLTRQQKSTEGAINRNYWNDQQNIWRQEWIFVKVNECSRKATFK